MIAPNAEDTHDATNAGPYLNHALPHFQPLEHQDVLGNVRFWKDNLGHANGPSMSQLDPQDIHHNNISRVTPQIRPGRQGRGGNGGLLPRRGRW